MDSCETCSGMGYICKSCGTPATPHESSAIECPTCNGAGEVSDD